MRSKTDIQILNELANAFVDSNSMNHYNEVRQIDEASDLISELNKNLKSITSMESKLNFMVREVYSTVRVRK